MPPGPGLPRDPGRPEAAAGGAIAGSTITLADAVRRAIAAGLPVPEVAAAASTVPARLLGLGDRAGALRPGLAADLVVCDDDFRVRAVMRHGHWLAGRRPLPHAAPGHSAPPARPGSAGPLGDEHELAARAVGGVPHLQHPVILGGQARFQFLAPAEPQRGI